MDESRGIHTYKEIMSQGSTWKASLANVSTKISKVEDWLKRPWKEALFIGCGSTHYLSLSAASCWQSLTGIPARGLPSSEIWLFPDLYLSASPPLLVAVSRSGETTETLRAIDVVNRRYKKDWMVISCYPQSKMAVGSPNTLFTTGAEEKSVAQTRSFTSMLLMAQYAVIIAAGGHNNLKELESLPTAFDRLVSTYESLAQKLAHQKNLRHFVFLGSGINYGIACEAMLKAKEMSLTYSEAYHFLEFRHGPKSIVTPETMVIGLVSEAARAEENKVLSEMGHLGATVLAISESGEALSADHVVELKSGVSDATRGVLYLPVIQLLAYYRALENGLNPDQPTNLESVVFL